MINYQLDAQGIATLSWDMPGRSQNVMNADSLAALYAMIDQVTADPAVRGILMTSAKSDFFAGGDLAWLLAADNAQALFDDMLALHRHLRKLESAGKPVAMALPGSALGGGLEIALAGHYRVAADQPKARFGLPEVSLGLLPGGGGTQRLPRLIGIQNAMPLLLEGKKLKAADAQKLGLLDAVVPAGTEVEAARAWLLAQTGPVQQPWDNKGYKIPGGAVSSPAVQQLFMVSNALLRAKTHGNYPAPANILSCLYEGLSTDIDTGLKTEARYFVNCALSPQAKNMIRTLFFSMGEANKLATRPGHVPLQQYTKVGILGAGMMGAGIAHMSARAGITVVLLDTSLDAAERGKTYSKILLDKQVARGRMTQAQADAVLARLNPTTDYAMLADTQMVIEAVFEDRGIKADVTRKSEAMIGPGAVFASNTSTLPITGLAQASARPANFIGLHFFSPVDKMPLVEVIMGKLTSQETLARALDFIKTIGMTPIVVNDARGFYTSRCFSTYVLEGLVMLTQGVKPALIEAAGLQAGMPVGPLMLTDEVSIDLLCKIDKQAAADLGAAYQTPAGMAVGQKMMALGRLGKRVGQGFYDYPEQDKKTLWPGLTQLFPLAAQQPASDELVQRLINIQSLETARCMEEGVVTRAQDADVGSVLGWGFPAFRGGTISHIHSVGLVSFVQQCDDLAAKFGERFKPTQTLRNMAARGQSFYHH